MSKWDNKPDVAKLTKSIAKSASQEAGFVPSEIQAKTKARFYRRLEEMSHVMDKETVFKSPELLEQLAGTPKVHTWLANPLSASWFVDGHYVIDTISSLQQKSLEVLKDLLGDPGVSPGDRIKTARILLELGDQFPGRKSEVRFLDDRINDMSPTQVESEIAKLKGSLDE